MKRQCLLCSLVFVVCGSAAKAEPTIMYKEGQPGPYYSPRETHKSTFNTKAVTTMPQFAAIPAYTGKYRMMGGNTYTEGVGSVASATFEVTQPLSVVLNWYAGALQGQGWEVTRQDNGFSGRVYAKLPGHSYTIDIQLLATNSTPFRTRVYAKEAGYQNVTCPNVGGGKPVDPDQVKPLGGN